MCIMLLRILPTILICFLFLTGCWIPGRIYYELGYPKNLPDWPKNDPSRPTVTFETGDRFVLLKPTLLSRNDLIKPPYFLELRKSGSAEIIRTLPSGTVIRLVALKDRGLSGVGEYFVIEGLEEYGWVFIAGGSDSKVRNGRNIYEFNPKWLKKI